MNSETRAIRNLVIVLGDQLDRGSSAFDKFDPECDRVWMAEVAGESKHVWSHKARIALFLSAMRHFRDHLRDQGTIVEYHELDIPGNLGDLETELRAAIHRLRPDGLVVTEPGEWRVREAIRAASASAQVSLDIRPDRHFLCSMEDFAAHTENRKQLRMEHFYHEMRRRTGVLMEGTQPAGGRWNYDSDNRKGFGREGPPPLSPPKGFRPDAVTQEVLALVERHFPDHPGSLKHFNWAVTPEQARETLDDFIANRLANFGPYEDAMWTNEPYLFHSRLSCAANLKLLDPREAISRAEEAWKSGQAPLPSVEGFIRQFLGWREFVRGIYWRFMPDYAERNELDAQLPLPRFYWTADTDLHCLRQVLQQTLDLGYAHHIQRLMVTGLFALMLGVHPARVHEWYLAIYVDAVEWVELPNTLGMSQYADGGVMASKPYIATGKYLQRMSNYCAHCRYDPAQSLGEKACPFTTLYWDFLGRHEERLARNPRMALQVRNLARLSGADRLEISNQAAALRRSLAG